MDGVLADFEAAFREIELQLFGEDVPPPPEQPETRAAEEEKSDTPRRRASDKAPPATTAPAESGEAEEALPAPVLTRRKLDRV